MFNHSTNKHKLMCIINVTKVFLPITIKCFVLVIFAFQVYQTIILTSILERPL